jgi:hypothetical protein
MISFTVGVVRHHFWLQSVAELKVRLYYTVILISLLPKTCGTVPLHELVVPQIVEKFPAHLKFYTGFA